MCLELPAYNDNTKIILHSTRFSPRYFQFPTILDIALQECTRSSLSSISPRISFPMRGRNGPDAPSTRRKYREIVISGMQ